MNDDLGKAANTELHAHFDTMCQVEMLGIGAVINILSLSVHLNKHTNLLSR